MHGTILYSILNADSGFRNACGVDSHGNIKLYPAGDVPQTARRPYAAYTRVSRVFNHNKQERGPQKINVQIDIYASSKTTAEDVENAAMMALDHYKGEVAGHKVKSIRIQGGGSGFNPDQEARHRISEYSIHVNP